MLNLLVGCLNLGLVMGNSGGAGNCDNTVASVNSMGNYAASTTAWTLAAAPTTGVKAGDTVTLTISRASGTVQYKGLSLYCENSATKAKIGAFNIPNTNFQPNGNCDGGNGLTHTSSTTKTLTKFNWTAPATTTNINVQCKGIAFNTANQWQSMTATAFAVAAGTAAPSAAPTTAGTSAPTTAGTTLAPTTAGTTPAPTAEVPSSAEAVGVSMAACALALAMMA